MNEKTNKITSKQIRATLLLVLGAAIWGFAFVAQSVGMDYLDPVSFHGIRFMLAAAVIFPFILYRTKTGKHMEGKRGTKFTLLGGIVCGVALCAASLVQQIALVSASVAKAGFITALYIVIVPLFGIFRKKFPGGKVMIAVGLSVVGMYLLCIKDDFSLTVGDSWLLLCALLFAVQITFLDYFVEFIDPVLIAFMEFLVCGVVGLVWAALFIHPSIESIIACAIPILYAGALSGGVAYTIQVVAQKDLDPTVASLIMSFEAVFSLMGAVLILNQGLEIKEIIGAVLMFVAIILSQL